MHQYRHKKLPVSFENMFQEITENDALQTRHNEYNFINMKLLLKTKWNI